MSLTEYIKQELSSYTSLMEVSSKKKTEMTKEKIKRVDLEKLELAYIRDPLSHRGVELILSTFLSSDYRVVCSTSREQKAMDVFLKNSDFKTIIYPHIAKDQLIYGNSWIEKLYKGDSLVGLSMIDAKSMDFKRDINGRIVYDKYGEVKEYVQYLELSLAPSSSQKVKSISQMGKSGISLDPKYIVQIPYQTVGNNPNGIGVLEPIYNSIIIRQNMEKALGENIYNMAMANRVVVVGDEKVHRNPGKKELDELNEKISNVGPRDTIVIPYYVDIKYIQSQEIKNIKEQLGYFVDLQVGGMGLPKPLVTGSGEAANRQTLEKQNLMFLRNIKTMQRTLAKTIEENVFAEFARENGFKEIPRFEFEDITIESLDARAKRLATYISSGVIEPDGALSKYIKDVENFPRDGMEKNKTLTA